MIKDALLKNGNISQGLTPEVQEELGLWVNITSHLVTINEESKPRSADMVPHKLGERFSGYNVDPGDILGRAELAIQLLLNKPVVSLDLYKSLDMKSETT